MIYTVTFNPAIDYVVHFDHLRSGEINRNRSEEFQFGGTMNRVHAILFHQVIIKDLPKCGKISALADSESSSLRLTKACLTRLCKSETG